MSASVDLQRLIVDRLKALQSVSDLVGGRIFDNPQNPKTRVFPDITVGSSDVVEDDEEGITGQIETIQIDCWAREHGRVAPVKPICAAVKRALHLYHADPGGSALVELRFVGMRYFIDVDGITAHGAVTMQAIMEE